MNDFVTNLRQVILESDEKTARAYVIEHINEFPDDLKKEIIFSFVQEALELDTQIKEIQADMATEGAAVLKALRKDKNNLVDKEKIIALLEKIKK